MKKLMITLLFLYFNLTICCYGQENIVVGEAPEAVEFLGKISQEVSVPLTIEKSPDNPIEKNVIGPDLEVFTKDDFFSKINSRRFISTNSELTNEEMAVNAEYIYYYLLDKGWSKNAILGLLGNIEHESYINPGKWQNGCKCSPKYGYGIVQWTPARDKILKYAEENGLDASRLDVQLDYLTEMMISGTDWVRHKGHYQTSSEFMVDTDHDAEWLCSSFYNNYEMAFDGSLKIRQKYCRKWLEYFKEY